MVAKFTALISVVSLAAAILTPSAARTETSISSETRTKSLSTDGANVFPSSESVVISQKRTKAHRRTKSGASRSEKSFSADETAIKAQAMDYEKAFTAGDATALANMWVPEGIFIDCDGTRFKSRAAIQQQFETYFRKFGAQQLRITVKSITFPEADVAVEEGQASLYKDGVQQSTSEYVVVHVKRDGQWQMLSSTETAPKPAVATLSDLNWLAGEWVSQQNPTLKISANWDKNHHFLRFGSREDTHGETSGEYQVIGSNPLSKQIISWHFDSTGGYGQGNWFRDGNDWYETAYGMQRDGKLSRARYVFHKVDNDKFTWRSTDRSIDGTPIPDTQEVTILRASAAK